MGRNGLLAAAAVAALGAAGLAGAGLASSHAEGGMDHEMMDHGMDHGAAGAEAPSTAEYLAANEAMHAAMDIEFTGDADVDFARGMIGHHQGAIDMAEIVLEHGDDPAMQALAREVIAAQSAEIELLETWLAEATR